MHKVQNVFFILSTLSPLTVVADYTVECEGYNSDTSAYVSGECSNGSFEGFDSETNNYVYGTCTFDGELEAYDSETSQSVYGECEGE